MVAKIGIFYGSTTGNTENVAQEIQKMMGKDLVDIHDVDGTEKEQLNEYEFLIFGIPTWDIGQLQEDWEDFIETLDDEEVNIEGKKIAIFGVGDQEGYPDTFGDAMGAIYDKVVARKAIVVSDKWPTDTYNFDESLGVKNGCFVGMMVDEDNQFEMTQERIKTFVELIRKNL